VLAAASCTAVLLRRRFPFTALGIAIASTVLAEPFIEEFLIGAVAICLYAVAVYRSNRASWIGAAIATAVTVLGALFGLVDAARSTPAVVWTVTVVVFAVLCGINVGNRKRYLEALIDRAAQLARERDQQARLATAAERARIAREMHDIVSHSLTVMVTLADGSAALAATAPDRAADAMGRVAETGRLALADMRRMLGVLNERSDAPAELEPQPQLTDVAELIERFRAAGLHLTFSVSGTPPEDPGIQLTVYRVLQEALTNVLRHAPSSPAVTATVRYDADVTVVVENDPPLAARDREPTQGAGRGLLGMRERVALYGGTLTSSARPDGGWRVHAVLRPTANGDRDDHGRDA
jgi:signal transduction histidine kinase